MSRLTADQTAPGRQAASHSADDHLARGHATVVFELNGQTVSVNDVDPHCTLLEWLRASGRTGTKEGCAEGECGACAVVLVARNATGQPRYEAVNSCLVSLPEVHGRSVVSVEGVARRGGLSQPGELHPVQQAMVEAGGSQCGYCTPGFVMSLFAEYYRPGRSGHDPEAIGGNLCRCTGYRPIVDAARRLSRPRPDDPWLSDVAPRGSELDGGVSGAPSAGRLPALDYVANGRRFLRPESLAGVFEALGRYPNAKLLGGGTDLMVYVNQRHERYPVLISLAAVPELCTLDFRPGEVVLGAGLSLARIERALEGEGGAELRLLAELLPLFSSRLIRNRATLGGNLGTASPIGDSPPVLLALGAELGLASASGQRRLPLCEFFAGYRETALAPGELIVSVHVPRPLPRLQRFYKVSKRVMDDISSVSAAFALDRDPAGCVERLRVAYGGIAATPLRAYGIEQAATGRPWDEGTLRAMLQAADALGSPLSDHRASAGYRKAMIRSLLERFFLETSEREEVAS
jgi:xanthine dehydrogenase small subunit